MNQFNRQYFFVDQPRDDDKDTDVLPFLTPDESTAKLPFQYQPSPIGTKPLMFFNGEKEANIKDGVSVVKTPPPVLFAGNHPVVNGRLKDKLQALELPNIVLQPAVFVDEWDKWHEDYWYVTFLERLDCWDRQASDFERSEPPIQLGGFNLYQVYRFSLDDAVLSKIAPERRMLFQMGGSQEGMVVAHQSIAPIFTSVNKCVQVLAIDDYPAKY